ncbi:unnamed protein product [Caenorhabditis nigoni]
MMPPSGQILVRLPSTNSITIGGKQIKGRSNRMILKPVSVYNRLSGLNHQDIEDVRKQVKQTNEEDTEMLFETAHKEIGQQMSFDSVSHYRWNIVTFCFLSSVLSRRLVVFLEAKRPFFCYPFTRSFRPQRARACSCCE